MTQTTMKTTKRGKKAEPKLREIEEFFSAVASQLPVYKKSVLQYLAIRDGDRFSLLKCRLRLRAINDDVPFSHFVSANIIAGQYSLEELAMIPARVVSALVEGALKTPKKDLCFNASKTEPVEVHFTACHPEGLATGNRLPVLSLQSAYMLDYSRELALDWELKSSPTPYANISELASAYGLGAIDKKYAKAEIVAETVGIIGRAEFRETGAAIDVKLPDHANRTKLSIGYRLIDGKETIRSHVPLSEMSWRIEEGIAIGQAHIAAQKTAHVYVVVSYQGQAQSETYISHPSNFPNPLRQAHEAFDPELEKLKAAIYVDKNKPYAARDFEAAVSWLCWMHGFQVSHLDGGNQVRISECPDLLLFTPSGDFAVVECTTDILKAENKVAKLIDRAARLRARLAEANQSHRTILPVIITSKTSSEISAEREDVEKMGVLVLAREELERMIADTVVVPEAQKDFQSALEYLNTKRNS